MDSHRNRGDVTAVNAAIYARDAQGDPSSLDDQISACRAYADQREWRIDGTLVFTDGVSGATTTGRPGLAGLLDSAQCIPQPFTVVLMRDTSRLGRRLVDVLNIIDELQYHGVSIVFVDQALDSAVHPAHFRDMLCGSAMGLDESLSHVIRRGQKSCVAKGFIHGGRRFGYDHAPVLDPTRVTSRRPSLLGVRLTINPVEAAVVHRIFELHAQGLSYRGIADLLNAENSSDAGNLRKWNPSSVCAIVKNPIYVGHVFYGRTRRYRDPESGKTVAKPQPKSEWQHVENPDLRIVSDELWRKAQDSDDDNRRLD